MTTESRVINENTHLKNGIKPPINRENTWERIRPFLQNMRWWYILVLGSIIIVLETVENAPGRDNSHLLYYAEVIFSLILLILAGALIKLLSTTVEERTRAINTLKQKHDLATQLSSTQDINEIALRIVQNAYATVPSLVVKLYINDHVRKRFLLAAHLGSDEKESLAHIEPCQACLARNIGPSQLAGRQDFCSGIPNEISVYCIPLVRGTWIVGLLHLYRTADQERIPNRVEQLENLAEEMSSALGIAVEKKAREEIALTQTVNAVQLDLARDLHDTLGQNISYLRLKLEHLSNANPPLKPDQNSDIKQMYEVVNESFDLVRGTLAVMQSGSSASLINLLSGHARMVAERSNIKVDFTSQGKPEQLTPRLMRQLFYIFREGLSNVEKHANASQVCVEIIWAEKNLILTTTDNGNGFNLENLPLGNHYGLKFMRERTEKLNGQLIVRSIVGGGTNIVIQLPYAQV